ncbi:SDR family oxidoreductase [Bacillus sp. FJAT-27986]|uniref:SDR family oxidoreductase n=1 Tax=Bacillus sp. FJAT-27986 TaxID=1743146 RepID=UPI00080AF513|nr:SDR family oxidoreductase [Bacillus sp. FJAT-27986]OCA90011.1 NAD(P)-dependent oxidoreductase [Bacillus sp. FJAT-27986]
MSERFNNAPGQEQEVQPGLQYKMDPEPITVTSSYKGSGKLKDKVAIITGGDSGIGQSVAVYFAKEGADVAILYVDREQEDAEKTKELVEAEGRKCLLITGDVGYEDVCINAVEKTVETFGKLDILVNNAAEQHVQKEFTDITSEQLERTFRTNIFGYFYMAKAAMKHLPKGGKIINSASVTAYQGNPLLIDYSSTKGAIVSFTRALSNSVAPKGIYVNAVAPGPIWTPLIPASFSAEQIEESWGQNTPLGRIGQPDELAPTYVYLASDDSSYVSGQTLHVNGGSVVNG